MEELLPKVEIFLLIMGNLESVRVTLVSNYVLFTYKRKHKKKPSIPTKAETVRSCNGFSEFLTVTKQLWQQSQIILKGRPIYGKNTV